MALTTILAGNPVPLILQAGETLVITLATNSSGSAEVPGQSVSTSMTAGGAYSFGHYAVQREVVVTLTAGTATADFSGDASGGLTSSQVAWVQSSVSGGGVAGTVTSAQIIAGTLGSYTADTTYITADTSGGVDKGTLVRWDTSMAAWVFDFYRSATVL